MDLDFNSVLSFKITRLIFNSLNKVKNMDFYQTQSDFERNCKGDRPTSRLKNLAK